MKKIYAIALSFAFCGMANSQGPLNSTSGVTVPSGGGIAITTLKDLPSVGSEDLVAEKRRLDGRESAKYGILEYVNVEDGRVDAVKRMLPSAKRYEEISDRIAVKLSKLGPDFAAYTLIGYVPEGTSSSGPFTWVSRLFRGPQGQVLRLSEWDFRADNGGVLLIKEFLNQEVNDTPATLALAVGNSGSVLWSLVWSRDGKQYTLDMFSPVRDLRDKQTILKLARSLSDS